MQFFAIFRRRVEKYSEADFAPVLEPEAEAARTLYAEGVMRASWSRLDVPGACSMLECDDEEHARATIARLPLVANGMLEVTLIPLKGYRGFGPRG